MAVTTNFEFNLLYEDDSTSKLTIGPFDSDGGVAASTLKSNVMQFLYNDFNSATSLLSLSKYGNKWAGFESVKIRTTDKNIIF